MSAGSAKERRLSRTCPGAQAYPVHLPRFGPRTAHPGPRDAQLTRPSWYAGLRPWEGAIKRRLLGELPSARSGACIQTFYKNATPLSTHANRHRRTPASVRGQISAVPFPLGAASRGFRFRLWVAGPLPLAHQPDPSRTHDELERQREARVLRGGEGGVREGQSQSERVRSQLAHTRRRNAVCVVPRCARATLECGCTWKRKPSVPSVPSVHSLSCRHHSGRRHLCHHWHHWQLRR